MIRSSIFASRAAAQEITRQGSHTRRGILCGLGSRIPAFATAGRLAGLEACAVRNFSTTTKSWMPTSDTAMQHVTRQSKIYELTRFQVQVAEALVPWFTTNMPVSYFRQVCPNRQLEHLRNLLAIYDCEKGCFSPSADPNLKKEISLSSALPDNTREMTLINYSGNYTGLLLNQLDDLPFLGELSRLKVYTSIDDQLCINIYSFGKPRNPTYLAHAAAKAEAGAEGEEPRELFGPEGIAQAILDFAGEIKELPPEPFLKWDPIFETESLKDFIATCPHSLVSDISPRRFLQQRKLIHEATGTENAALMFERNIAGRPGMRTGVDGLGSVNDDSKSLWLNIALANTVPQAFLHRLLSLFRHRDLELVRLHLDTLENGDDTVMVASVMFTPPEDQNIDFEVDIMPELEREIKRLKWVDDKTLDLALGDLMAGDRKNEVGVVQAEILTCLNSMLHPMLSKQDVWMFSKTNINAVIRNPRYLRHATGIADLFAARFDPMSPLGDNRFRAWTESLRQEVDANVEENVAREVLLGMIRIVEGTLRTNLFLHDRYGLSLRLDPTIFRPREDAQGASSFEDPYGVFFVHGRRFNGFHVRFRDIARGGMRLVTPQSVEQHSIESARHFDEAYGLAFAQQLKNKDIPEGGSKCVVLIDTVMKSKASLESTKHLIMRKSVKAFTDSLLDLIVDTPETRERVVDYLGKSELIYLGPDEQVLPEDINWIIHRAQERGYPIPAAFMSSKPDAGINHKTYGVTSEGVQVFLDTALRDMGMHPIEDQLPGEPVKPVTIKLTGGPDGDVAGNMIKILNREYGDNISIVGLSDASGAAEDEAGLDAGELLRLVREELPVAEFSRDKLSSRGVVHTVDTEEGLRARNTMHNRISADAFIPAGGRPSTINETNWRSFVLPSGVPSSRLVVEGANLFITPAARELLFKEAGVRIVKDSSANKCGVICSSFEIMSSMLLSEEEFSEVKEELVADVLVRLRELARLEAELLFREFNYAAGALPHFSERISNAILKIKDASIRTLDDSDISANLDPLIMSHLPPKLREVAGDRVHSRVPLAYVKSLVASAIASKIVYREGIQFIENLDDSVLAQLAFDYLTAEAKVDQMLAEVEGLDWGDSTPSKDHALSILRSAGVRSFLGKSDDETPPLEPDPMTHEKASNTQQDPVAA